jgi:endonuclease/exonuclease/phosphatase family metal-dependent hydrolase
MGKELLSRQGWLQMVTWGGGMTILLMKHKIVTWNVRGLNKEKKRLRVRRLLRQWKVDIVCLQETKLEMVTHGLVQSLWSCPYVEWSYVASHGASGGILLMWDRRVVSKVDVCQGSFVAACSFRNVDDGMEWAFAGVYGPNMDAHRRQLWEELAGLMCIWELPWCIGGDFNVTLFHNERSGGARRRREVADFADFTAEMGLMDLPLAGGVSTWANNLSWSRLDRFLVSLDWELSYPGLMQKKLLRVCSDHAPIVLMRGCERIGKSAFKFENMWLKEEGFVDKVKSWWSSFYFMGSPSFILAQKLRALKEEIKRWNREVFGNVGARNKAWAEELESLDRSEEVRRLSDEEKERKRVLVADLEASLLQEEISWRQKSRVRWLKEGDKCTKFFIR